jgi:hypothetical protein
MRAVNHRVQPIVWPANGPIGAGRFPWRLFQGARLTGQPGHHLASEEPHRLGVG